MRNEFGVGEEMKNAMLKSGLKNSDTGALPDLYAATHH
jgi:hypothetical protein